MKKKPKKHLIDRRLRPAARDDSGMQVMNRALYERLVRVFRRVRISRHGEARVLGKPGPFDEPGRPRVVSAGEQYFVACPFCEDLGKHLCISPAYGLLDEDGEQLLNLAYCHANNCM